MKFTLSLLAVAAGSASAFAPTQEGRASSAVAAKPFSDEVGAMAPVSAEQYDSVPYSAFLS
jgi:hypothetical protein